MSKLSQSCEERKAEAEALADKFNKVKDEIDKLRKENDLTYQQFLGKNAQYAELMSQLKEEEGSIETSSEVVE